MTHASARVVDLNPRDAERVRNTIVNLSAVLDRLEAVLREENVMLEANSSADHGTFIHRKNQILRELMVLQKSSLDARILSELSDKLVATRNLVDRNHKLLQLQVGAMTEVASIMKQATLAEESDGTYSRPSE
jgi:hypothetical protein